MKEGLIMQPLNDDKMSDNYKKYANNEDRSVTDQAMKSASNSYLPMALMNNFDHYSWCATRSWEMIHAEAIDKIKKTATGGLLKSKNQDCLTNQFSLAALRTAYLMDLSGMHFLTDLFAAGHTRSERQTIVAAWKIAAAKVLLNKLEESDNQFEGKPTKDTFKIEHLNKMTLAYIYQKLFPYESNGKSHYSGTYVKKYFLKKDITKTSYWKQMMYDLLFNAIFQEKNEVYFQTWAGLMNNIVHDADNKSGVNVTQFKDDKEFKIFGDKLLLQENNEGVDTKECLEQLKEQFLTKRKIQYDLPVQSDKIKCKLTMNIVNSIQPSIDHIYYSWKKNFCSDEKITDDQLNQIYNRVINGIPKATKNNPTVTFQTNYKDLKGSTYEKLVNLKVIQNKVDSNGVKSVTFDADNWNDVPEILNTWKDKCKKNMIECMELITANQKGLDKGLTEDFMMYTQNKVIRSQYINNIDYYFPDRKYTDKESLNFKKNIKDYLEKNHKFNMQQLENIDTHSMFAVLPDELEKIKEEYFQSKSKDVYDDDE